MRDSLTNAVNIISSISFTAERSLRHSHRGLGVTSLQALLRSAYQLAKLRTSPPLNFDSSIGFRATQSSTFARNKLKTSKNVKISK